MKITKEKLKTLIKEELDAMIQLEVFDTSSAGQGQDPASTGIDNLQDLRKELVDMSRDLTGITAAELPHVQVALELIRLAKNEPIENEGDLKAHLMLVAQDLEDASK